MSRIIVNSRRGISLILHSDSQIETCLLPYKGLTYCPLRGRARLGRAGRSRLVQDAQWYGSYWRAGHIHTMCIHHVV
jgi:hypothetical protein